MLQVEDNVFATLDIWVLLIFSSWLSDRSAPPVLRLRATALTNRAKSSDTVHIQPAKQTSKADDGESGARLGAGQQGRRQWV